MAQMVCKKLNIKNAFFRFSDNELDKISLLTITKKLRKLFINKTNINLYPLF